MKTAFSPDKMSQALCGYKANSEQVILFALPVSKHWNKQKKEIAFSKSTQPPVPIIAVACYFVSDIDRE